MIAYFPEIYEDELIYSVLSRFYVHSGYLHFIDAGKEGNSFFGGGRLLKRRKNSQIKKKKVVAWQLEVCRT